MDWPSLILPWIDVAYKAPAYTDTEGDSAALDALAFLAFSSNSELYQKLVVQEQKVDTLMGGAADRVDPGLFEIMHTTLSMRRLKPDPVHDALIHKSLEAGA
mgnify:CR=1 FL=1